MYLPNLQSGRAIFNNPLKSVTKLTFYHHSHWLVSSTCLVTRTSVSTEVRNQHFCFDRVVRYWSSKSTNVEFCHQIKSADDGLSSNVGQRTFEAEFATQSDWMFHLNAKVQSISKSFCLRFSCVHTGRFITYFLE